MAKKVSSSKGKAGQKRQASATTRSKGAGKTRAAANTKTGKSAKSAKATKAKAAAKPRAKAVVKTVAKKVRVKPLPKAKLAMFRKMLLDKRRSIIGDMNGIEAEALRSRQSSSGDLSSMPTHPADIGTDNYEHEFSLGLLESERALLVEIDGALERVDGGIYGICLGTGAAIGEARLKARPWAKYCIEYAKLMEKGLARPHVEGQAQGADDLE